MAAQVPQTWPAGRGCRSPSCTRCATSSASPMGPVELAKALGVTSAASSGRRRPARGPWSRRAPPHAADGRRTEVVVTESGRREVFALLAPMFAGLAEIDASLDDDERASSSATCAGRSRRCARSPEAPRRSRLGGLSARPARRGSGRGGPPRRRGRSSGPRSAAPPRPRSGSPRLMRSCAWSLPSPSASIEASAGMPGRVPDDHDDVGVGVGLAHDLEQPLGRGVVDPVVVVDVGLGAARRSRCPRRSAGPGRRSSRAPRRRRCPARCSQVPAARASRWPRLVSSRSWSAS